MQPRPSLVKSNLPTPLPPTSPTSMALDVSGSSQWHSRSFAMPLTPDFSPTTTDAAPFQPFVVGERESWPERAPKLKPAPEPEPTKPRTLVLCFDGAGNKFGEVSLSSVGESINDLAP